MAPIIIIGAGLVGLTLAQALKKDGFEFEIYDRDNSLEERPAGWGITMHWALPALESCLPADVFSRLLSIQVDPAEGGKGSEVIQTFDRFSLTRP
jgi:2-polyprenyl-6-methoxyphenol hydroxylase-like FAD-dependent oxidoreductase